MRTHIPSLDALESPDDRRLEAELRLDRLRSELAVVRALLDCVDHVADSEDLGGCENQIVEEMARLGCRVLEAAASLARPSPDESSGVFVRHLSGRAVRPVDSQCADCSSPARSRE